MARITVFGGMGFVGSHLSNVLISCGHEVTVFVRGQPTHALVARNGPARLVFGDFNNPNEASIALEGAEVVFHLIGNTVPKTSNDNPEYDIAANILPSITLFALAKKHNVDHVIFASSGGTVYGEPKIVPTPESHETFPICSYGIQKLAVEHYMRLHHRMHGTNMTVLRFANIYGPGQNLRRGQGIVGVFLTNLLARKPLCVFGDGRVVRDYIFVSDVADAMAGLVEKKNGYQVFNVGTQQGTSIEELIQALRSVSDLPIEVNHLPGRTFDLPVNILNCEKIRSYLGWQPKVTLHDGLRLTWDWFRSRGKETSGSVA